MTDKLSPAAQAVLNAITEISPAPADEIAARALLVAANQVVPEENVEDADYDCLHAKWAAEGEQDVRERFLKIATELENIQ